MGLTLPELSRLGQADFVRVIGPVFERSPWVAAATWAKRPFADLAALHQALCETVQGAGRDQQLSLIRAHPDLAGRAARAGTLSRESAKEQAGAGLGRLSPDEIALFQKYNEAYQGKFGFPFVICARLNQKQAILAGFARRLQHARAREIKTALEEIFKIAKLRLQDVFPKRP